MMVQKHISLASLLLLIIIPLSVPGQGRAPGPSEKQIRARKLATQWEGKQMIFLLNSGDVIKGRPVNATFNTITISHRGTARVISIVDLNAVILRPGLPEILLSFVAGVLGGALGYGAVDLTVPTASSADIKTGAALMAVISTIWGVKTFYHDIRYDLEVQ